MKYLFFVSVASCIFSGTYFSASAQNFNKTANKNHSGPQINTIKFIEGIEIKADDISSSTIITGGSELKKATNKPAEKSPDLSAAIEKFSSIQFKYAQILNCNVEDVKNIPLYSFIEEWWETRYRYGGTTKSGIDCSAFSGQLISEVYNINLPRTAREQYNFSTKEDKEELSEGDLVFFNTRRGVSHVGVYLGEGYFVHASSNNGVTISNLDEPYYSNRFIGAGKVIDYDHTASIGM